MFRKGPIGDDIGRALDQAAQRSPEWRNRPVSQDRIDAARGAKTVDAVALRAETYNRAADIEWSSTQRALKAERDGKSAIVSARMTDAGASPFAVARTGAKPHVVEHTAIEVGSDGSVRIERSATLALLARSACAVFRLAADGYIDFPGVKAALAFAWAGDVVLGGFRVRTSDVKRVRVSASLGFSGEAGDRDAAAAERWTTAKRALSRSEFLILNGVMRFDQSAAEAARSAYPRIADRARRSGIGDQALITATLSLADEFGFLGHVETWADDVVEPGA
jgi:hypothetical protein